MFSHGLQVQRPWASAWRTRRTPRAIRSAGQKKFYTCYGCHGVETYKNAYPDYSVPGAASSERGVHHRRAP